MEQLLGLADQHAADGIALAPYDTTGAALAALPAGSGPDRIATFVDEADRYATRVAEHWDERADWAHHLWALLMLELWYRTFITTT